MPEDGAPVTKVGVGVIVMREGRILVGKRKGSLGAGTWAVPGGHLEFGESFEDCAVREVKEETGLDVSNAHLVWSCQTLFDAANHVVTIFMRASVTGDTAEPELREPDKCEGWQWLPLAEVPEPRFAPLQALLDDGFNPDDDTAVRSVQLADVAVEPVGSVVMPY